MVLRLKCVNKTPIGGPLALLVQETDNCDMRLQRYYNLHDTYDHQDPKESAEPGAKECDNADWHFRISSGSHIYIGGHFNAGHTMWVYSQDTSRGLTLVRVASKAKLKPPNMHDIDTKVATHKEKQETFPGPLWILRKEDTEGKWEREVKKRVRDLETTYRIENARKKPTLDVYRVHKHNIGAEDFYNNSLGSCLLFEA
ncbi:hypothetical protein HPB47_008534 [Ixodes persulcatus]|uniref:Uncharacterized protein n=1 Tax=Ixodes persulcatus TaxID=34615 RepID=A0AC60P4J5_IXOPE|nr:hypothetical protein HPB47_008534 [Ixodes persulcatus]